MGTSLALLIAVATAWLTGMTRSYLINTTQVMREAVYRTKSPWKRPETATICPSQSGKSSSETIYEMTSNYLSLDNLNLLRDWIHGFGAIAPLVFVAGYAIAVLAFLPATPLTLLGGLVLKAVWGTLWAWVGATVGATLAFLMGRYAARGLVESWKHNNERVRNLDEGVEEHGWRMLLITRLVPVFPFSLQNYAYGLTKIGLLTYVLLTPFL